MSQVRLMPNDTNGGRISREVLIILGRIGLGDALEAFPTFKMIKDHWSGVNLVVACNNATQEMLVSMSPDVSRTIRINEGIARDSFLALRHLTSALRVIKGFDTILILNTREKVAWPLILAAKLTGAKLHFRHGLPYRFLPDALLYQMVTAKMLELPFTTPRYPEVSLTEADRQFAKSFFGERGFGHEPKVIINPGTADSLTLGWPVSWGIQNFARVANALAEYGAHVLINGGTEEQMKYIESCGAGLNAEVAIIEKTSVRELAAIIGECDVLIGDHSGPADLALALGTPVITIETVQRVKAPPRHRTGPMWWPRRPGHTIITKVDWCRANMGSQCRCRREEEQRHLAKRLMRRLKIRRAWKKVRKKVLRLPATDVNKVVREGYACLEAVTVEEVVDVAKRVLSANSHMTSLSRRVVGSEQISQTQRTEPTTAARNVRTV